MPVRNYTKSILIRAREDEAQSWALCASESGKKLSMWGVDQTMRSTEAPTVEARSSTGVSLFSDDEMKALLDEALQGKD
jgi:hypothetical protein